MARLLTFASSEYLELASALATATPISFAAWVRTDDVTKDQCAIGLAASATADQGWMLMIMGSLAGDKISAVAYDSGGWRSASTSSGVSVNTWHHACAVFAAANSRAAYLDGGSKGTNTTSSTPTTPNQTAVGRMPDKTPAYYFSGRIAHAAIWSVALSDAEVALLAAGVRPSEVQRANLVEYWELDRDKDDGLIGGNDLTAYNTPSVADGPPLVRPSHGPGVYFDGPAVL